MALKTQIPHSTVSNGHKKNENGVLKKDKKRKRINAHEESEPLIPVKRRRARGPPDSPEVKDTPSNSPDLFEESPFYEETHALFLPLSPISYQHPIEGLCAEHLSPLILTFYPPFNGVILSYSNTRLSSEPIQDSTPESRAPILARSVDEYAVSFVWMIVDFLIFRPRRHNPMEGWINLQNEGNLGLVCWNFFNVTIERRRLPKAWTWVPGRMAFRGTRKHHSDEVGIESDHEGEGEESRLNSEDTSEGHFADEYGNKVEGLICFRVTEVVTSKNADRENGFLGIKGTMLDEQQEKELRDQNISRLQERSANILRPRSEQGDLMSSALVNGHVGPMIDAARNREPLS
ncbi:hypothetical protein MMC07_008073 [Pseudocyphellaria aurata]|nr:hypothetical protein [Pseudocyphellaria aurata]